MAAKKKEVVESAFDTLQNEKHKLFVSHYVGDCLFNATKAYLQVYPYVKYNSASVKGCELLRNVKVKAAVDEICAERFKQIQTEAEKSKTYEMIKNLSDCTIDQVVDLENGTLTVKDFSEIPKEALHLIESIQMDERQSDSSSSSSRVLKVKLINKLSALKLRSEIQGLSKPENETQKLEIIITPAERPKE
jgi:phage terminase small subunit